MQPLVRFLSLVPGARMPERPDATFGGAIPLRAHRYCEPFVQASGFGWTLFSPIDFRIVWDGHEFSWRPEGTSDWKPLTVAQMPGYSDWFARNTPEKFRRLEVPFLWALPERGVVQVWTGMAARTRENWSLLVRGPANHRRSGAYFALEGIVEFDWWGGPVFGNLQFTAAGQEARFTRATPMFVAQPVAREAYAAGSLDSFEAVSQAEMSEDDWLALEQALFFGSDEKPIGAYAKVVRKRAS